jgi:hypothetical protein
MYTLTPNMGYNSHMNTNIYHRPHHAFLPHRFVRSADIQTLLARYRPRHMRVEAFEHAILIDAGEDHTGWEPNRPVRLHGYYTPSLWQFGSRGLVLVLHGWEGCSHSVYNLITADTLTRAGYDVFRLNVRDHGPGLHIDPFALNRGFFMGTLFEEVVVATRRIAEMAGERPFYIVGASMGGNLALRLAIRHSRHPFHHLKRVIAFNPAINPKRCAQELDLRPSYLRYFRSRWLRSLQAKQRLFPGSYHFAELEKIPSIYQMTEWLVEHYGQYFGHYQHVDDYFGGHSITGDAFQTLTTPTLIITSANDRVVPVVDFYALQPHPLLTLQIHPNGGHVGYVDLFPLRHTLPGLLLEALRADPPVLS